MRITHVVPGPDAHGVTRHALTLAGTPACAGHDVVRIAAGQGATLAALTASDDAALLHLHLTDHLLAPTAAECAEFVVALARSRPVSLTLHDLPQPGDGPGRYERRRRAYAVMAAHARGIVVASEHERRLLHRALEANGLTAGGPVEVIPLPVEAPNSAPPAHAGPRDHVALEHGLGAGGSVDVIPQPVAPADPNFTPPAQTGTRDLVVFGYLYPGKGHAAALDALDELGARPDGAEFADVGLLALGAPSPGHEYLLDSYADRARDLGRRFTATGYLPDAQVSARLRAAAVPLAAADQVSASGSIGSWLSAGRRPIAPVGPYVDELEARCPGAILRYGRPARDGSPNPTDTPFAALADAVHAALIDPSLTWLGPDVRLGPGAAECGQRLADVLAGWAADLAADDPAAADHAGADGASPQVTVVIPYYDDQAGLDRVLTALERSDHPAEAMRVVVADDGSPTPPDVGFRPYTITLVRQEDRGFRAAAARNLGARTADDEPGDVLLFLDGDTVPEPGYVGELARATRQLAAGANGRALAVGRRRHADFGGLDVEPTLDLIAALATDDDHPRRLPDVAWLEQGYAATANLRDADERSYRFVISAVLAVTRELFDAVGGFDESFVGYGGEDWDLANRCFLAGADFAYVPTAVAWHDGPDAGGREPAPDDEGLGAKTRETLRIAEVVTEPGARDPDLFWAIPDIAVEVDDTGWAVEDTLLTCADLVRGSDARVWLRDGLAVRQGVWPSGDPRVEVGDVPQRVLERARYRVTVIRPARLAAPLGEICALGSARYPGLVVRRTRDIARDIDPAADSAALVTAGEGDRNLEAEWGWRRRPDRRTPAAAPTTPAPTPKSP